MKKRLEERKLQREAAAAVVGPREKGQEEVRRKWGEPEALSIAHQYDATGVVGEG